MRYALPVAILLALPLAGCTGDDAPHAAFPHAFLLQPTDAPDGYILLDQDHGMWTFAQQAGLDTNPGQVDPSADIFDSIEDLQEAWIAMYMGDTEDDDFIVSLALRFSSETAAHELLMSRHSPCEGGDVHALQSGALMAVITGESTRLGAAVTSVARMSGASDPCPGIEDLVGDGIHPDIVEEAVPLRLGANGPYDVAADEEVWFTFDVPTRRVVTITGASSQGDPYFELYDPAGDLLFEADDENGWDPELRETLSAGTYYLLVSGFEDTTGLTITMDW